MGIKHGLKARLSRLEPFLSSMTYSNALKLSEPHLLPLKNGNNNGSYRTIKRMK